MPVTDPKTVKNRVHLDLTSSAADRDQEVDRLLALGARRVDIGQTGAESWTVLADPEGMRARPHRMGEKYPCGSLVTGRHLATSGSVLRP
jgi:hypothetical protein